MVNLAAIKEASRTVATRPNLRVIDQKSIQANARRRVVYVTVCLAVVAGLFGVAMVQAQLVENQQHLDDVRRRLDASEDDRARLIRDVDVKSSPESIVSRAVQLGMVRAADPIYFTAVRRDAVPTIEVPDAGVN
ncbi:MAG: cell division protein FtsL [Acidimicrobiales bacterium]|jgi:cell division protein FtsL